MEIHLLAPGVQNQAQAQVAAQAVAPKLQEAVRGALEEQRIKPRRVEQQQCVKFAGQREDAVIISNGQQAALLLMEPLPAPAGQASWAMAVPAGTGGPMLFVTMRALEDGDAQFAGAATGQAPEQTARTRAQPKRRFERRQELAQDAPQRVAGSIRRGGTKPVQARSVQKIVALSA